MPTTARRRSALSTLESCFGGVSCDPSDPGCVAVAGSGSGSGSGISRGDDGTWVVTTGAREDVGVSSTWVGIAASSRGEWARVESTVGVADL